MGNFGKLLNALWLLADAAAAAATADFNQSIAPRLALSRRGVASRRVASYRPRLTHLPSILMTRLCALRPRFAS